LMGRAGLIRLLVVALGFLCKLFIAWVGFVLTVEGMVFLIGVGWVYIGLSDTLQSNYYAVQCR
jgi:hypothetical protein